MKRFILPILLLAAIHVAAQDVNMQRMACTSIMVGRQASTDGSVITSHTCDSWYRTWMNIMPAARYERDTVTAIRTGLMHTRHATDSTGVHIKGYIPQAKQTYAYLNTAYPCMNEHQLAMGETTIGGRDILQNPQGMFMIEELARVALERCTTAIDAIKLMGELAEKYGYADSGECLTVADKESVWIFEIFGAGKKKIGAVWAACRVPDDCVAVSANISRIDRLNLDDPNNYLASKNVFSLARQLGLWLDEWKSNADFSFWKAYSGENYFHEKKNYSVREYFILSQLAPSLNLTDTVEALPLYVRPDAKVSPQQVMQLLGSYYEGYAGDHTASLRVRNPKNDAADTIVSPAANPWPVRENIALYNALGDTALKGVRTVSVAWCAYSTVIQLRSWLPDNIGGVAWVALDNPGESPRFPIFSGTKRLPQLLSTCGQHTERDDAALWHYRKANRLATVRWGYFRSYIEEAQTYFRDKGARELPYFEQAWSETNKNDTDEAQTMLDGYVSDFFAATILKWDEIERTLWRRTWTGF